MRIDLTTDRDPQETSYDVSRISTFDEEHIFSASGFDAQSTLHTEIYCLDP